MRPDATASRTLGRGGREQGGKVNACHTIVAVLRVVVLVSNGPCVCWSSFGIEQEPP